MLKDKKTIRQKNIQTNIKDVFRIIDQYLPKNYTNDVLEKVPWSNKNQIRVIRNRKSGNLKIIMALHDVAIETKELLTT